MVDLTRERLGSLRQGGRNDAVSNKIKTFILSLS